MRLVNFFYSLLFRGLVLFQVQQPWPGAGCGEREIKLESESIMVTVLCK